MAHRTPAIYARRSAKGWAGWEYSKAQWPHRYGFDDPGKVAFRLCKTREPAHQLCLYLGSFPELVPSPILDLGFQTLARARSIPDRQANRSSGHRYIDCRWVRS